MRALVEAGLDVARINLSHGTHSDHERSLALVRQAAEATGRAVAVLADLQGPKIRLGRFGGGSVLLSPGDTFTITADDVVGTKRDWSRPLTSGLADDVKPGDPILVDDGRISLEVVDVGDRHVVTTVIEGGTVSDSKGINLPGAMVSVPAVSEKDIEDLRWALGVGVDLVALSFVRTASDIEPVLQVMADEGVRRPVIAKIEKPQAVSQLARNHRSIRRHHGGSRRPRGRASPRGSALGAEACCQLGAREGQASHRGYPDA